MIMAFVIFVYKFLFLTFYFPPSNLHLNLDSSIKRSNFLIMSQFTRLIVYSTLAFDCTILFVYYYFGIHNKLLFVSPEFLKNWKDPNNIMSE